MCRGGTADIALGARASFGPSSGAHPVKKNEAFVGTTIDQIAAQHMGQDTPLPSIELSMEPLNLN